MQLKCSTSVRGVFFVFEDDGSVSWSTLPTTPERVRRFKRLQELAIKMDHPAPGALPLRLVCLDAVHPASLKNVQAANVRPYAIQEQIALEWEEASPPRIERRFLSALTAMAWRQRHEHDGCSLDFTHEVTEFLQDSRLYSTRSDTLKELISDFEAWCSQYLPASLFAHTAGVSCLSAIPRAAWARKLTGMAIREPLTDGIPVVQEDQSVTSELLEISEDATGSTINMAVLGIATDIFSESSKSPIDGIIKREWAHKLANLGTRLLAANPRTAVLVAWAAYLCENGTVTEDNPAANTVHKYISTALPKLGEVANRLPEDPFAWRTEALEPLYAELINSASPSIRGVMSAALSSFHMFLEEWFDVEPMKMPAGGKSRSPSRVHANVIWQHEIDWCIRTAAQCADPRMGQYAQAMLVIAANSPIRRTELKRLHIRNIIFAVDSIGEFVEIEIVRDAQRGRLKTNDSQRRLLLRGRQALAILRQLVNARLDEGASGDTFLFGDPGHDWHKYRPAATEAYVNNLLKCATGQRAIRFHSLRHTVISQMVNVSWRSSSTADVSPLEQIAASAGHASPAATLRSYSHLYEAPLRLWLDHAICKSIDLTTAEWSMVIGYKPNTLSQKVRRTGLSPAHVGWRALQDSFDPSTFFPASDGFEVTSPNAPTAAGPAVGDLVVTSVIWALQQFQKGTSDAEIAKRMHLASDAITQWREKIEQELRAWRGLQFPRKFSKGSNNSELSNLASLLAELGIDFSRMWQSKYQAIASYLQKHDDDQLLKIAVSSWRACSKGVYLSLSEPTKARGLLEFLRAAGVMASTLSVCHQQRDHSTEAALHESLLRAIFKQVFDVDIKLMSRDRRPDRPVAYLFLSSPVTPRPIGKDVPKDIRKTGAASEMGGFSAWMTCVHAYLLLKDILKEPVK